MFVKKNEILYDDEDLLSPADAAKLVGVARTTVNYWIRNYGLKTQITPGKRYKIKYSDFKLFMDFSKNKNRKEKKIKRRTLKYKIAILEPILVTRRNYIEWLKDDYDLICITNLAKPLRELKRIEPDIILMDVNLTDDKVSFSILDDIKREMKLRNVPIIIITKNYSEDDVVSGLEKGACDYVKKPVGQNELKARIKNLLRFFIDI
ncbi:response regulator [Brachyspira catarrhinii]|uniref:Response regulator n=1 Tax=Brachyspira catarrhinii TaxID=2528966 RepID=A0ABY2TT27_9SPIR|nr:response regulator [Brachyspira catarrhinii]